MVSDDELYKIINLLFTNYDKIILDKIYNDYVLYFNNKLTKTNSTYTNTNINPI